MRVYRCVGLALVLALNGTRADLGGQAATAQPGYVPGELIVKYRPGATGAAMVRARAAAGASAVAELARRAAERGQGRTELVRLPRGASLQAVQALLQRDPAVEYAEPNWIYTHQAEPPSDSLFGQQWALENSGQTVAGIRGTADADIDAIDGWAAATSGDRVYIGVIDEGIDFMHPDLGIGPAGAIWTNPFDPVDGVDNDGNGYVDDIHGWDFSDNSSTVYDGSATDPQIDAHGTHVAGIIAARRGNGIGVAGISRDAVIIPAKFLGVGGGTTAGAVQALDYFVDLKIRHGLNIVATNDSWAGGGYSQALLDAIGRAAREDILFVTTAGNGGPDEIGDDNDRLWSYPGNYDTTAAAGYDAVISVTATDQSDRLAGFANFGATTVDLAAPGSIIISTTPQNSYSYSSGTSMAAPHVTGAVALAHALTGRTGADLRDTVLEAVDAVPALAGRTVTGGRLNLGRLTPTGSQAGSSDIVLYAANATSIAGNWSVKADPSAAGGSRLQSANLGAAKVSPALASPVNYFELTFNAEAGLGYHLWIRARAEANGWANDSVHVQFDNAVTSTGAPAYRIGSTGSAEVNLEDCSGCGLSGWGWQDNGYGAGVQGPLVYFATNGRQRIRIQTREDGVGIDQIVLSGGRYVAGSPGALKNDTTVLGASVAPPVPVDVNAEIVLHAGGPDLIVGAWRPTTDATAAGGVRLQNPNAGAPKITAPLAAPADYFEMTFRADAGRGYRLWIRGRASGNSWANDSVHVQFSDTITGSGTPVYRIGSVSSAEVNLEECLSCGVSGWGWQDNGYGAGVLGPELRFATTGVHTIRLQVREDGLGIDQIVLSALRFLNAAPGAPRNDATILTRTAQ